MTERLYYLDSQLCDFEASIVDRADGGRRVYLDRTAFYPTSGGQPCDTGQLDGIAVHEVVDEADRIAHILAGPLEGVRVRGQVNWSRRFDHMQQHSGQHLLSAVLADLLGYATLSVHFGPESSTIDLDAPQLTPEQISRVEERANEVVAENHAVQITFEETTTAIGLRKASERSGAIRVITIQDIDRSACGGTHVRATGEIGPILLRKVERIRKGVRVEFLCGLRAIRQSRAESTVLAQLTTELSAAIHELPHLVAAQRAELKQAGSAKRELEATLNSYRARELYAAASPDRSGIRRTLIRDSGGSLDQLRGLAQAYTALPRAVLIGAVESPPSVLLGASTDSGLNAGLVLKAALAAAGGRGGGSATFAQGVVPSQVELEQVIGSLGRE